MEENNRKFKTEQEERDAEKISEMEAFCFEIGKALREVDKLPQKPVKLREEVLEFAAKEIEKHYGDQAEIKYETHSVPKNDGLIEMRFKELHVENAGLLMALATTGGCDLDINSYKDGTVGLAIGFDGMTEFIGMEQPEEKDTSFEDTFKEAVQEELAVWGNIKSFKDYCDEVRSAVCNSDLCLNNKYLLIDGCDNIEIDESKNTISLKCVWAATFFKPGNPLYTVLLNTKSIDIVWVNSSTFDLKLRFAN